MVGRKPMDMGDFLAMSEMMGLQSLQIGALAAEAEPFLKEFEQTDPLRLATTFGGLLTYPHLQSNCIRLEALIHLAIARSRGQKKPDGRLIFRAFSEFGHGSAGRLEDPAEDVFVASVGTMRGNFMLLEGVWEAAGFYTQRFVNLIDELPGGKQVDQLKGAVYALLRLSDLVCRRARLQRYTLGNDIPESVLPAKIANSLSTARRIVSFTEKELEDAGISPSALSEFIFDPNLRTKLNREEVGNSTLERRPVIYNNGEFLLVLPTAVSVAIRRMVVEWFDERGIREALLAGIACEYGRLFAYTPLLGGDSAGQNIEFQRTERNLMSGVAKFIDVGRCMNIVFVVDTLEGFEDSGFVGKNPNPRKIADDLDQWIDFAYHEASSNPQFLEGITIVVGCGIGRAAVHHLNTVERNRWRIEFLSAADFCTLCWTHNFKPLSLWRLLDIRDKLEGHGVELHNANGLLNLVAWSRSLNGHLIPHGALPDDFVREGTPAILMINQNSLRDLRHEVLTDLDPHVEADWLGRWVKVRKEGRSLFEEDRGQPLYAVGEPVQGRGVPGVYITQNRPWWCKVEVAEGTSGHFTYERWKMLTVWLARSASIFEEFFSDLPEGAILYIVEFKGNLDNLEVYEQDTSFLDVLDGFAVNIDGKNTIHITVSEVFERGIFNVDNISERALVCSLARGAAALVGRELSEEELAGITEKIVPDNMARQTHAFRARWFRDFVADSLPSPILIDSQDDAAIKLGLGWRRGGKSPGYDIYGKGECIEFLNGVVSALEDELCSDLRKFKLAPTLSRILINHEAALVDRERWSRTSAAILSLHNNKEGALETIAQNDFKLNAVLLGSRLLAEFALCEAGADGELIPGQIEISRWMAKARELFDLGGLSDAIRWGVMEPRLKITALGDIHANFDFLDEIIEPFARETCDIRTMDAANSYSENIADYDVNETVVNAFDPEFAAAWKDEMGASIDDVRNFVDYVEDLGVKRKAALLKLSRSELLEATVKHRTLSRDNVDALIDVLTLNRRSRWRDIPEGYDERDRQPWRFRRRLSILRKPLIKVHDGGDPEFMVAPGILRDSLKYTLSGFYRGDFPVWQLKKPMNVWAGRTRDKQGNQFTQSVAKRLSDLGWSVEVELQLTKLLRKRLDKNYGDIDVLAWDPARQRLLVIECKDVQYKKTFGEISEQLADFRGEIGSGGKPDLLLKHLNRVGVISSHIDALSNYVGWKVREIESHLVFKNPVPVRYALARMSERVKVTLFDGLEGI